MPEATLKEKTAKGLFWGGISNFVQQVIGMAFGIAIARILSPDDYGLVAMLAIFTAVANTVMDSGFTTALVNRKTIEHKDYNAVFWFNVFVAFGIYVLLFFAAPWIARFYNQPVLVSLSRVLFLTFIISATGVAHNALLLKKIMAKQRGVIDMAAVFGSGAIGLILALNGFAFWGLVIQQLSQVLIIVVLRWRLSPWRPTFEFDWAPLREMFGFSVKVFVTGVFSQITYNLMTVILGKAYHETMTGYYSQGNKWAIMGGNMIVSTLNNIAQPVLVEAQSDRQRQLNVFRKMLRFGAFITFPALLGLAFAGKEFILIALGPTWRPSIPFLQIFCIWGLNSYLIALYMSLAFSHGKSYLYMNIMTILFAAQLLSLLVCYYLSGNIFVMVSTYVGVFCCSTFFWHLYTHKLIGLRISDVVKDIFPYVAVTALAIGGAWGATIGMSNVYLSLAIKVIAMTTIYITLLWLAGSTMLKEAVVFLKVKIQR
ncbi:lipopolysaccharide biosynthesis protein [Tannerella sp.]|uniref:lipopolysaccharide biosynthesis protein n=1 Tax=Tannerella sp. TaxID=2382127 RepID=UPI0026DC7AD5|nr:lipopolysaccharide biosynthesis protein [Tannerella sp.]MDO4702347.1 lipopolysaccharide biosynthesis protein [Tannerella sp.]